jgi:molybdate transport system substrate-binding protein
VLIESLKRVPGFRQDFAERILEGLVAEPRDGADILKLVEQQRADVGIVYTSDARMKQNTVFILEQSPETAVAVEYTVGVLKSTRDPARLKLLLDYMLSPQARVVLTGHGLEPAP